MTRKIIVYSMNKAHFSEAAFLHRAMMVMQRSGERRSRDYYTR